MSYIAYRWARAQIGGWGDDELSKTLEAATAGDPPFYGTIMLAMRRADTENLLRLQGAFPDVYAEQQARYNSPFALLKSDPDGLKQRAMGEHYPDGLAALAEPPAPEPAPRLSDLSTEAKLEIAVYGLSPYRLAEALAQRRRMAAARDEA